MITGYSVATLVVFIISIVFVIYPVSIPTPRPIPRIPINLTTAPIIAIAILWAAQCLDPAVIRGGIVGTDGVKPYNILILFFSLAYMAITLDITGILQSAAFWVSNKGGSNGWKLYTYFYIMLTLLSIMLGNDPVILSGTAFLVYYTKVAELNHISWLMSEFAAANTASMVLFVGNPTNVVICEGFSVNNAAFTAYTILPFIACSVFCFFALGGQYRDPKYVPRRLDHTADLDARSVLLDPIGACVGSFLLASTLILCLVVSFFGIDVWKISLPFAVAKFIYDVAWDHYRFARQIPMLGRGQKGPDESEVQPDDGVMLQDVQALSDHKGRHRQPTLPLPTTDKVNSFPESDRTLINPSSSPSSKTLIAQWRFNAIALHKRLHTHFPTFFTALPRLPFALVPFAFSQFILIEALSHQGWIDVFATWLLRATQGDMYRTIWLIGVLGVILCNISGTNIGATILLTKVVRAASPMLSNQTIRAAAIALAVASNIGAVSFTFSASLAGLLWRGILKQKGIIVSQATFAYWNALPLVVMTVAGLSVVCAEMAVLY
ncbi:uncharacterized protein EDB91DRAFT_1142076 [Suillus paluster]|uniref:uncharacterized protein n=1 Tax=Suillus paluster TaxID=48578 RepID=UPI001B879193|nr:uncharacterized protein EDB91DRAFT_1142076 [Suillus paluster]KAG1736668.1 hypothetical protein EDB91DRAFT_1142076 [Suillus paluster]